MEVLGHSSISLTMNTYSHVIPAMRDEVAAKMNGILTGPAVPVKAAQEAISEPVATSVATATVYGVGQ
jgi:hypothetical protein